MRDNKNTEIHDALCFNINDAEFLFRAVLDMEGGKDDSSGGYAERVLKMELENLQKRNSDLASELEELKKKETSQTTVPPQASEDQW